MEWFQNIGLWIKEDTPWMKWLRRLFSLLVVIIIIFDGQRFIKGINLGETVHLMRKVPSGTLLLYGGLAYLAVSIITLYDLTWFLYNPRNISRFAIFKTSWIANAINNVAGMGGLGGAMIRTVFYRKSAIADSDLVKINLLLVPSSLTGLGALMWFNLTIVHNQSEILSRFPLLFSIMLGFGLFLVFYIVSEYIPIRMVKQRLTEWGFIGSLKLKLSLVAVSTLDWLVASSLLWFIGHRINPLLSISDAVFFFTVASAVGIMSLIPAGVGSFDLMMIIGLQTVGFSATEATATLVLFRFFYYFLPFVSGALLAALEMIPKGDSFTSPIELPSTFTNFSKQLPINKNQIDIFKDFTVISLWLLMLVGGGVMIASSITPALPERIHFLADILSLPVMQFSHRATLLFGILLLVLADEIRLRVSRAFPAALTVLIFGGLFTLMKGFDFEEWIILAVIALVLFISKEKFYRVSVPFHWGNLIRQMVISEIILVFYILSGQANHFSFYLGHKGASLLYQTPSDYFFNGMILSVLVQSIILVWYFTQNRRPPWIKQTKENVFNELESFVKVNNGNALTHLIFTGDKYIYKTPDSTGMLAFRPFGDKLIVLGDPIGKPENLMSCLDSFRTYADLYGYMPVYYQVVHENLTNYHDIGYNFFKLGEEAYVNLSRFDLANADYKHFRNTRNRFEREGWVFKISEAPHDADLLNAIESLSNEWLEGRKEKGFSLGHFDREYLNKSEIGTLSSAEGKIVAFASLMPFYDKETFSVDLMRFSKDAPNSSMDYLFIQILQWGKSQGFNYFNLGMAPLSNVGGSSYARKEEKAAKILFNYGEHFYNFKGLRKYKEKFKPEWRSKYLAYPDQQRITPLLLDISVMINTSGKHELHH